MTSRRCIPWPDPRLRTPAAPVAEITDEIRGLWADMVDTMDAMPGVGLAAPQIGVALRLAVVDASEKRGQAILMANPEILHASIELREHDEAMTRPRPIFPASLLSSNARAPPPSGFSMLTVTSKTAIWSASGPHRCSTRSTTSMAGCILTTSPR